MGVPKTMRGAVFEKWGGDYVLKDIPVGELKDYEIMLKTGAAGYCHTDIMVRNGEFNSPTPLVGSHEPAGTIVALGKDAAAAGWKEGQRVGASAMAGFCGKCPDCKAERWTYCDNMGGMIGLTVNGAFATHVKVDYRSTVALPDNLDFASAAPLFCAGATVYNGLLACELKKGDTVGIVGLGALGHLGCQFAKVMGYKVVGVDSRDEPLDLARSLKYPPDVAVDSRKGADEAKKRIAEVDPSKPYPGVDAVIIATDPHPAFDFGVKILKKHGTLVQLGQPKEPVGYHYLDIIFRDIRIKGSLLAPTPVIQEMVDIVGKHGIEVKTKSYKLDDIGQMVEDQHKPGMKGKFVIEYDP